MEEASTLEKAVGSGFSIDREQSLLSNLKSPQNNDPVWDSLLAARP